MRASYSVIGSRMLINLRGVLNQTAGSYSLPTLSAPFRIGSSSDETRTCDTAQSIT